MIHAWWTKGLELLSSRSLLEGKRPVETIVVRFSSGDETIVTVVVDKGRKIRSTNDHLCLLGPTFRDRTNRYIYSQHDVLRTRNH